MNEIFSTRGFSYFVRCDIKGSINLGYFYFMIKIAFFLAVFLFASGVYAAPVGNSAAPRILEAGLFIPRHSTIDVRAGYEGDFVTNGRMNQEEEGSGRVDSYKQNTNSGTITLNFLDRIDAFGVFGSSETKANWRFTDSSDHVHRVEIQTGNDFLWAVGGRGILFEWGNACLGFGGRYSFCQYSPEWLTSNGVNESVAGGQFRWSQWQIDLGISYRIDLFTPYIGTKYSSQKAILTDFPVPIANNGSKNNHFENIAPVGLVLGCSLSNGNYFMLNLEARLVDEEAITVSGDIRF